MRHRTEWLSVYLHECANPDTIDLHQKFADMIGVTRQEAKTIHCQNMYSVPLIRMELNRAEFLRRLSKDASKELQSVLFDLERGLEDED